MPPFAIAPWGLLASIWEASYGEQFRISPRMLCNHTFRHPLFHFKASQFSNEAMLMVKSSAHRWYAGQLPTDAYITAAAGDITVLTAQLMVAQKVLRAEGITRLALGQDDGHLLPGTPKTATWCHKWLLENGFQASVEVADVERDLRDYSRVIPSGPTFKIATVEDVPDLNHFFLSEFPGRWRTNVLIDKLYFDGAREVLVMRVDGQIHGFALIQDFNTLNPISGGVWHLSLGDKWGAMGPIGISKSMRGKGLGDAMLGAALLTLKDRGVHQCIIDWTTLIDFYFKHGFKPARQYIQYRKEL